MKQGTSNCENPAMQITLSFLYDKQEYLLLIQKRTRWRTESANLDPGDIVLLKDVDLFMRSWPIGRVADTLTDF